MVLGMFTESKSGRATKMAAKRDMVIYCIKVTDHTEMFTEFVEWMFGKTRAIFGMCSRLWYR